MSISNRLANWRGWLFAALVLLSVAFQAGCSGSDTGEKKQPGAKNAPPGGGPTPAEILAQNNNAKPAAAAPAAAPAGDAAPAPAGNERKTSRNDKMAAAMEKAKKDAAAKPAAAPTALSSEDPTKWNSNDLKLALNKKDPRYNPAVAMRGATSRGDAAAGAELSQLLDSVAKLPADGSGALNLVKQPLKKKKKSSKRGDDEPATATAPAATPPAGAMPNPQPAAMPPGIVPGQPLKLNIGQGRER